jgi:hypothetical protein
MQSDPLILECMVMGQYLPNNYREIRNALVEHDSSEVATWCIRFQVPPHNQDFRTRCSPPHSPPQLRKEHELQG